MAATLALSSASTASRSEPRGAEGTNAARCNSGSFADAMQSQAPAPGADQTPPTEGSEPQAAKPRARASCEGEQAHPGTGEDPSVEADTELDSGQVQTLLGLCEAAPAVSISGGETTAGVVAAAPSDTASAAAPGCAPPLPQPVPGVPELQDRAAAQGDGSGDGDLAALTRLQASPFAPTLAGDERLASTLEAMAGGAADLGAGPRDGAPGVAGLAGMEARAPARAADPASPATRAPELRAPPGSPAWTDELGTRVTWMIDRGEQVASLRLTPENLGPLDVRIAVREGETTVWFGASHPETRAALEQSLPRLREMLGASGLALANAGVFSQTPRDPQRGFTAAALARAATEAGGEAAVAGVTGITHRGLVDLYA